MDDGVARDEHGTLEVHDMGNFAVESGIYTASDKEGKVIDTGKYILIWKKQDGVWRIHKDIFNTSMPAPAKVSDVRSEIDVCNRVFEGHFAKADAAAIAGLYTEDGQVLPTGCDTISGHLGITGFWNAVFGMGIASVKLETADLEEHGDQAAETGFYTMYTKDGDQADTGKYLVYWRKQQGTWKMHRDIFNTSKKQ